MHHLDTIEMRNAMDSFAKIVRLYYCSLLVEGFAPHEALRLAEAYQTATIAGGKETEE